MAVSKRVKKSQRAKRVVKAKKCDEGNVKTAEKTSMGEVA